MTARPSKLTPEMQEAICQGLRLGMPVIHVCEKVGISQQTFIRWRKAGKRYDDEVYVNFVKAIKAAHAGFVEDNLQCIRNAAAGKSWQAAAWLLERREREYFAMKEIERLDELTQEVAKLKGIVRYEKKAESA